jgi:hypothetical protein
MIKLHMAFWQLLVYGAALYLLAVFRPRGESLKRSLRRTIIAKTGAASKPVWHNDEATDRSSLPPNTRVRVK